MQVEKLVVHSLIKNENQPKASIDLSQNLLAISEKSIDLVSKLDANYRNADITNAVFDRSTANHFPREFDACFSNNTDNAFLSFSQNVVEKLRENVDNIAPAKGGYLVFAEYIYEGRRYISIYLLRDTVGMLFAKDRASSSFVINPAIHLDLEKLAMACRIDILKYEGDNGKYLSFIKKRQENISAYFIRWIAATETESNKIFTESLFNLINQVELPVDDRNVPMPREKFREEVFNYFSGIPTKIININDLSEHFYSNRTYLANFAETNNITLDTEFQPNGKVMKKFVRIDMESDGIHLRFSRDLLQEKIRFDEQNRNIVIIESERFASELRREIDQDEAE